MIKRKSKDFYTINKEIILSKVKDSKYLSNQDLMNLFSFFKENSIISSSLSFKVFFLKLLDDGLKSYSIKIRDIEKTRYTLLEDLNIFDFVNTLAKNSFFPMTTSLNIQNLTTYRDNFVFISKERVKRTEFKTKELSQKSIDEAFKKQPRRTKALDKLDNFNIVILETNFTNNYEIINFEGYKISSINRGFVEIISNIQYFQSSEIVIDLFKEMKTSLDIEKIYNLIEKFDFLYPYFQLFGFYLEKIGFLKEELIKFYARKTDLKFYTQKAKDSYSFDDYWNIYY